jgi:hypothetical protein
MINKYNFNIIDIFHKDNVTYIDTILIFNDNKISYTYYFYIIYISYTILYIYIYKIIYFINLT